jgi:small conductance mechanosensitive channel
MDTDLSKAAQPAVNAFEAGIDAASTLIVSYAFSIAGAVLLLIVGVMAAGFLERWSRAGLSRVKGLDETITGFLSLAVKYGIMVLLIVAVLAQFGVQTTSIIAALGAAGLAIGLALQGTLQNIAAGLMMLILRPIRVGEHIEAGDVKGTVTEIGLFTTEFKTPDGLFAVVPNSQLFTRTIVNFDRNGTRRFELEVPVAHAAGIAATRENLLTLAGSDSRILSKPEPIVYLKAPGQEAVTLALRIWVKSRDHFAVATALTEAAQSRLEGSTATASG